MRKRTEGPRGATKARKVGRERRDAAHDRRRGVDVVGDRQPIAEIGDAEMAREGAKIDFLRDEALAEQRRVCVDPAAFGDAHGLEQRARPDALAGEEGDLGRDFAAAFPGPARRRAPLSGRVLSVLGSFPSVAVGDRLLERVDHATKLDKTRDSARTRQQPAPCSPHRPKATLAVRI
jgi:hypothetical protein